MLALSVADGDIKIFMSKLLKEEVFDGFEARNCVVNSFARFEISGTEEVGGDEERVIKQNFVTWREIRPHVFNIIKGGQRPKNMKFVFCLGQAAIEADFPDASALFINIVFDRDKVVITTGSSQKKFSMDKKLDFAWDEQVVNFLNSNSIKFLDSI